MCVQQRGHKKDFPFPLPIFRQGARKMVRCTHSLNRPAKTVVVAPTRIVSFLEGCHQLDRPDFHKPVEVPPCCEQGAVALRCGVDTG